MEIFAANRLSNGNFLFPVQIHIDEYSVRIVKPGLIASYEKTLQYKKVSSIELQTPILGFTKIIISAYGLDNILVEGFERAEAEEIRRLIEQKMRIHN